MAATGEELRSDEDGEDEKEIDEEDDAPGEPWEVIGQFHRTGGDTLKIVPGSGRRRVGGHSYCATLSDAPLASGTLEFEFLFKTEHLMIGVFDDDVHPNIKGANYSRIKSKGAWCLENVRLKRQLYEDCETQDDKTILFSPYDQEVGEKNMPGEGVPLGSELNAGKRCFAVFDFDAGTLVVRVLDEERETVGEEWLVQGFAGKRCWPAVCVFGTGSCESFETMTRLTKSARKRA